MEAGKGFTTGYRLSPIQERIWSCYRLAECQPYRSHGVISLEGHVDTEKLQKALRQTVARHEILRSRFPRQPGMSSPFQTVSELDHFSWAVADLSAIELSEQRAEIEKLFAERKRSLFNFDAGPTCHALLVRLGDDRQMLILSLSALTADAATVKLLSEEIAADYSADSSSSGEVMQYVDVSEWHHDLLESHEARPGRNYWRALWQAQNARAVAALSLPFEKSPSREVEFTPDLVPLPADERLAGKIAASAKSQGLTSAEFLLGLWHMLLWRLTGQREVTVGVMFDGRRHQELQRTLGPLSKYLPVHAPLTADANLHDALKRIAENSRDCSQWQDTFSWNSVENPVSTFLPFAFEYLELGEEVKAGELRMRLVNLSSSTERFKVKLVGLGRPEGLSLELHYDRSRYERPAIARLGEQLALLLESALARPEQPASELEIVSGGERQRLLVEWNRSERAYPAGETIASLFRAQAHKTPERVAVVGSGQAMSYGELERRANRLAHLLQRRGVGADGLVGLCLERSPELVVGILGILKAGGAYVPLSVEQPKARLAQQLAGAQALVSESSRLRQLPEFPGATVCFDRDAGLLAEQPETAPCLGAKAEHLVYVIYTSGSTGVPKGVEIEHRNLVNYVRFMAERLRLEEYAEGLQFATVSTIAGDLGNSCIYPALLSGGTIHLVSYEMAGDAARLGRYVQEQGIDVLKIVPSHLAALVAGEEGGQVLPRKYLITGGEALSGRLLERIAQFEAKCQIINHYGPTETTVGSLTFAVGEAKREEWESATVPIGRPIANTRVYILDGKRQAVPVGVVGELYIAGCGVGRGYRNQPEMTAERFLADPFVAAEARMYRTGDLARYREDGAVEFLGRADDQVKVRGYRLELGEVEAVLAAHGNVKQAVVVAREDGATGEKRLAGYVVLRQPAATVEELRQHLREHLPQYMVPATLVRLDKLPLNANGKLDRQALPAPYAGAPGGEGNYVAPRTAVEQEVARIWAEVLGRQRVGIEDNFFDLGGHSLLATQVISRVRERFQIELALHSLFEKPTVSALAAQIESIRTESNESVEKKTISRVAREPYRVNRN